MRKGRAVTVEPIKYGMFIMPFHPPDKPLSLCFEEDVSRNSYSLKVAGERGYAPFSAALATANALMPALNRALGVRQSRERLDLSAI